MKTETINEKIEIKFGNQSTDKDKQFFAKELIDTLKKVNPKNSDSILQVREHSNTQDIGTIVSLILTSKVIKEIAKGLFIWLNKRKGMNIVITKGDIKLELNNLSANDMDKVEQALQVFFNKNE